MSQPLPGETLQLLAGELHAIGQRLTYLGTVVQAQAATQVAAPAPQETQPQQDVPPQQAPTPQNYPPQAAQPTSVPQAARPPVLGQPQVSPYPGLGQQPARPRSRIGANLEPSRVLAWVGAGVTLLGVVFLLVLAVQQDWLGPGARVTGGAVLAALLVGAGWWMHRRSKGQDAGRIAAFALATTGFAALFLDVVAATSLYGFVSAPVGLGAGLLVSIGGLALADRWQARPLALGVVLSSAICAPLITQLPNALLIGFLVLLQVAATPVQVRRGWSSLALAAGIPVVLAALLAAIWGIFFHDPALVIAISLSVLLGVVIAAITAGARPDADRTAIGLLVTAPTPAFLAGPLLLESSAAGLLGAGTTALLLAIWAVARFVPAFRDWLSRRFTAALGAMASIAAAQTTLTVLDSSSWATALLCEALVLSVGAFVLRSAGVLLGATCYATAGFLLALFNEVPLTALLWHGYAPGITGLLCGLLIAAAAIVVPASAARIEKFPKSPPLWTATGVALLYGTASATMAACLLVSDTRAGFLTAHILITLSWVVAAIALLLRGIRAKRLRIAGLVLIAASLAKLLLFDLATLDGVARVIAFLCAGLILLAAGSRYARLLKNQPES
ncbi:DUF2339 domain-containing protein [Saccharopolyspora indica]|uniref:DUF2339 domain-containing protein n=1 Tax=Saccharopolyspora indica TaxID=1229659 RepID=UPI0022EAA084|nr:DUF2339 domain-containing protein [Saccharopolyspora indica]MDA3647844.1 DUF2339 domain-containing protein [Saccharopolyspora indica]